MMLGCQVFGVVGQCRVGPFVRVQCMTAGKTEFTLAVILGCLAPGGVGVHMVEDHDVAVAKAEDKGEMASLVCVQCVL